MPTGCFRNPKRAAVRRNKYERERKRCASWPKELWLTWKQIDETRGCFFNDSRREGKYWLTEPQRGHDFIPKHTADVFSLCVQFSRPKSKYRKSTISPWVSKNLHQNKINHHKVTKILTGNSSSLELGIWKACKKVDELWISLCLNSS